MFELKNYHCSFKRNFC